jgi:hypothetical protein
MKLITDERDNLDPDLVHAVKVVHRVVPAQTAKVVQGGRRTRKYQKALIND